MVCVSLLLAFVLATAALLPLLTNASCPYSHKTPYTELASSHSEAQAMTSAAELKPTTPLWPQPSEYALGDTQIQLSSEFAFVQMQSTPSALLQRAFDRYTKLIFSQQQQQQQQQQQGQSLLASCSVSVKVVETSEQVERDSLDLDVDESYSLFISASSAASAASCTIEAGTVWGALHALETFSQLLLRKEQQAVVMAFAPVTIVDAPRFSHRGVLIDTSRHFLSVEAIKQVIDALPSSKMNVLHWHMVDAQSFPLDAPSAPAIVKGAYESYLIYSMNDVSELHNYAIDRGVRILYEIDVPGHAASWGEGYPQILSDCIKKYYYNINDFALNPTIEETYDVLTGILRDVRAATGTKYLHLGGDEVVYGCWQEDASIVAYMQANGIASFADLLGMFVDRADKISLSLGATPIHWEDVFIAGITPVQETIFDVWTDSAMIASVTSAGYRVIAAPSNYWYLDHLTENTWDVMYSYEPTTNLTTTAQAALVIGGEASMWGEKVDESNLIQKIFPIAAAVGERLWSPQNVTDLADAGKRINMYRCRLVGRGVPAAPVQPGYCPRSYV